MSSEKLSTQGRGKERKIAKKRTTKKMSRSTRAGLLLPVARIHRQLKNARIAKHIGSGAPVYMAAVLEYLTMEVLELAGNVARDSKKKRITPRMLTIALRNDEELSQMVARVTIAQGGVMPHISSVLLKPMKKKNEPAIAEAPAEAAAEPDEAL
jgi:histone H2A